jgi:DNA polymerase-1
MRCSKSGPPVTPPKGAAWLLSLYEEVWLHDFEFLSLPGEHPDVVCLVAHELRSGQTLRLWRDELDERPPYRTDKRVLFVNFVANAECACHLALGWPLPANVLDLNPAFRNLTNGRSTPEGKGLLGALRYYGFSNTDQKRKDAMHDRIMRGWPFTPEERQNILAYCAGDVNDLLHLLTRMLPEIIQ